MYRTFAIAVVAALVCPVTGRGAVPRRPKPQVLTIPFKGDETPLARVKADPVQYVGRTFIICGAVGISKSYSHFYKDAKDTHYSFLFLETVDPAKKLEGEPAQLYLLKTKAAARVVDYLVKEAQDDAGPIMRAQDNAFRFARVMCTISRTAYAKEKQWDDLEVIDVQFIPRSHIGWQPWILEKHRKEEQTEKERRSAAARAEARAKAAARAEAEKAELRTWRDSTGKFTVMAKFRGVISGKVRLEKADGNLVEIPMDRLSKEDQEWIPNRLSASKQKPAAIGAKEPVPGKDGSERRITNSIGMSLVLIPAGEFKMGSHDSPEELVQAYQDYHPPGSFYLGPAYPLHRVRITKPFYLGVHEVTLGQFLQFVKASGYKKDAEGEYSWREKAFKQTDRHPVVNVSWNDATEFCKWLSGKEGETYRLPTEAEWEYACRAGTATRNYHGNDPEKLVEVGNVADATYLAMFRGPQAIRGSDGYAFTAPVGQFRANVFGLYDMHGNVWEWCADWYHTEYYRNSPVNDPLDSDPRGMPGMPPARVRRGGSWKSEPFFTRSDRRTYAPPASRSDCCGFRVVRNL